MPAAPHVSGKAGAPAARSLFAAGGGAVVLAAAPAAAGPAGSFNATPLAASGRWSADLNGGSFNWSYPLTVPAVPGDLKPELGLSYSSSSIDGRSANSNNQASWAGDGFGMAQGGFVERSYKSCGDDGVKDGINTPGDLCWGYDNATISFQGHSGELIPVSADEWRIQGDDNTKVVRLRDSGRGNGDNDGEYFKATLADGTQYFFGYNRLPNWATGKPETKSVFTVPVFGDDANEPCHASSFASSWCQQGWRWNLDLVIDPAGTTSPTGTSRRPTPTDATSKRRTTPPTYGAAGSSASTTASRRATCTRTPSSRRLGSRSRPPSAAWRPQPASAIPRRSTPTGSTGTTRPGT